MFMICSEIFGSKFPQVLAVFTGTIGAISDGMQYGWTSPAIQILRSKESPVAIQESDITWLELIYMIGGFAGLPVTIFCVDKIGRKYSILLAAIEHVIAWILIAFASSVYVILFARFLAGLAGDVAFVAGPMYIAEVADKNIRGFLAAMIYIMMLIGIIIVYSVTPFVSFLVSSSVGAFFVVFQLATFSFMPESPYYLFTRGRNEQALRALERLRGTKDVQDELQEIATAVERQNSEKGRPIDLITVKSNRKALLIMTVLNAAQHFSSISVILMNIHEIIKDADAILSPEMASIVFSAVMLISTITASFFLDRFGRKILLVTSSLLTGLSLAVLASYFALKNSGYDTSYYNWVPLVIVMIYAITFKFGLGLVPIVMTGEMFPTSIKAIGMTVSDAMYVIFAIISIYLYQELASLYGLHVPFFIFAGSCLFTALFAAFVIPETKGKTLDEIQFILKGESSEHNNGILDKTQNGNGNSTVSL